MARVRCHYLDCDFLDDGNCSAAAIEIDPDSGCLTYSPVAGTLIDGVWTDEDGEDNPDEWDDAEDEEDDDDIWFDSDDDF